MKLKRLQQTILLLVSAFWIVSPVSVTVRSQSAQSQQTQKSAADKETVAKGQAWFYQRCSLCHLGRIIKDEKFNSMGPSLSGVLKDASPSREAEIREFIQKGTLRMPGFQYGLSPRELDEVIAYIKTL
jgi:mono/diheme cytochrome c family protein